MDRDKKITLSLFLTWVVFGLFNLFGQPQAFVPPIIVDGVIITGLGVYFLYPFRKNGFYFALIPLIVIMLILTLAETNWIKLNYISVNIPLICCLLFSLILLFTAYKTKSLSNWERSSGIIISIMLSLSFYFAYYRPPIPITLVYSLYLAMGILCLITVIISKNLSESSIGLRRILLVLLLNFLFDTGNYLALRALA